VRIDFTVPDAIDNIRKGKKTSTMRKYTWEKWFIHQTSMGWKERLQLNWVGDGEPRMIAEIPHNGWSSELTSIKNIVRSGGLEELVRSEGFDSSEQMFRYFKELYGTRYDKAPMIRTTWEVPR